MIPFPFAFSLPVFQQILKDLNFEAESKVDCSNEVSHTPKYIILKANCSEQSTCLLVLSDKVIKLLHLFISLSEILPKRLHFFCCTLGENKIVVKQKIQQINNN